MKFKIGDTVRIINEKDDFYNRVGKIVEEAVICDWRVHFDNDCELYNEDELKKEEYMFSVGDIVKSKIGCKGKVLAVTGELIALSYSNDFDCLWEWYAKKELENAGYKLASEEETILSMQEVADKFGVDVDKLKIKKDK